MRRLLTITAQTVGAAAISYGAALAWLPLGIVIAGGFLLAAGVIHEDTA